MLCPKDVKLEVLVPHDVNIPALQPVVIKALSPPRIPAVKLLPPQDDTHPPEDSLPGKILSASVCMDR